MSAEQRAREQRKRLDLRLHQRVDDRRSVMQTPAGRRLVAALLEDLRGSAPMWSPNAAEGGRRTALFDAAARIERELRAAAPDAHRQMVTEALAAQTPSSTGETDERDDE